MFDTLASTTPGRGARGRLATLPAAIALHAAALGGVGLAQLWAVEELPAPAEAMTPVFVVELPPPPPPPPPRRSSGDRAAPPPAGPVQPVTIPGGAPAEPGTQEPDAAGGVDGGVEGGVDGGVPGGVPGADPATAVGPPDDTVRVYRVGGPVIAPVLLHRVLPEYPEAARRARLQGVVVIEAVIDRDGVVAEARVLGDTTRFGGCAEAALRAVRAWRYQPARLDDRPVAVRMTVTVTFSLA